MNPSIPIAYQPGEALPQAHDCGDDPFLPPDSAPVRLGTLYRADAHGRVAVGKDSNAVLDLFVAEARRQLNVHMIGPIFQSIVGRPSLADEPNTPCERRLDPTLVVRLAIECALD